MKTLNWTHFPNRSEAGLVDFLGKVQAQAAAESEPILVSIAVRCGYLSPLAVLEAIHEPGPAHAYIEQREKGFALAAAEPVWQQHFSGKQRFAQAEAAWSALKNRAVCIGEGAAEDKKADAHHKPQETPGGLTAFFTATFEDDVPKHTAPKTDGGKAAEACAFPHALHVWVPQWQVWAAGQQGQYGAVANVLVQPKTNVAAQAQRIWAAHQRFQGLSAAPSLANTAAPFAPPNLKRLPKLQWQGGLQNQAAKQAYVANTQRILGAIAAGKLQKCVLARTVTAEFEEETQSAQGPLSPFPLLGTLRSAYPSAHVFSLGSAHTGATYIGATPECLVQQTGGYWVADCLAGTVASGHSAQEEAALAGALLASKKDMHEHALVVNSVRSAFKAMGLAPENAPQPSLRQRGPVQHLYTQVRAKLYNNIGKGKENVDKCAPGFFEAVGTLHPTPALAGYPVEAAAALLQELEGSPRGLYGGCFGYVCAGQHNSSGEHGAAHVNIRSALLQGHELTAHVGAGIVAGSVPQAEFEETEAKLQTLKQVFK